MNAQPNSPQLTDSDIDRVLATANDCILPSSGFAGEVMSAILHDASAPAPIPFPWKRALPGLAGIVVAAALLLWAILTVAHSPATSDQIAPAISASRLAASLAHPTGSMPWIVIALAIPVACLLLCRRLIAAR